MKIDYFSLFLEEISRILSMLNGAQIDEVRNKTKLWRNHLVDSIYDDFLPPFDRRDMLAIVQNLSYLSYEVYAFIKLSSGGAQNFKNELSNAIEALFSETKKLKHKKCNILRLKLKGDALLLLWFQAQNSNTKKEICDSIESIADSYIKLCDALETAIIVNS